MSEQPRPRVLALFGGGAGKRVEAAGALLAYLQESGQMTVDVASDPARLRHLDSHAAVLALSDERLEREQEDALLDFVRGGGGLVALHGTLAAWARGGLAQKLAGWAPDARAPRTELRLTPRAGHPVTDRLPGELLLVDELELGDAAPEGATLFLTAHWHFADVPVAFARALGRGRVVHLGLGGSEEALTDRWLARLVFRSLRHAAGLEPAPPIGVGLLGYGAIAREHGEAVRETLGLELRAVCDRAPERQEAAARDFSVPTFAMAESMLGDPAVELVIVGTPPNAHAAGVIQALEAGRHVVCEKPFALRADEVDRMLTAAAGSGRVLTVYQSRRWDPDFVALRSAVEAGRVGRIFYMESFIGGFSHPCSFWHSHEPVSGGTIYDWGSHYFDWILQLFAGRRVVAVSATDHKRVWLDVTNADQVRVDLRFEDGAEASFMQSDIAAAPKPKWYLLGTGGAIQGDWTAESADSPARLTVYGPGGNTEQLALPARERHGFYRNLADHLLQGEPLAVPPQEARRNVAVMEAAARSIAAGGRRLEVDL